MPTSSSSHGKPATTAPWPRGPSRFPLASAPAARGQPIAGDLPNTGQYIWQLKANLPQRAYLRLEVLDAAGNVGTFELPEPAALDLSSPSVPLGDLRPLGWNDSRTGEQTYFALA